MLQDVLSRGIIGNMGDEPMVACPMHKKTFSLTTGKGLSDPNHSINAFEVKEEDGSVFVKLPAVEALEELHRCNKKSAA